MRYETTVQRPVTASGVGLHSGVPVTICIRPAPAGTGIVFERSDLESFPIAASWPNVARVSYATSLMRQGVLISTTEHLLSVFYAVGIDNALIEIDNLEVPILDGSGLPFLELIRQAGVKRLRKRRRYLRILQEVSVESNGKRITILPATKFRLSCLVCFDHPMIGEQRLDMDVEPDAFGEEIAPARTFGFDHEFDKLRDMGLIRGASLENAIGFTEGGVLNPGGLRYPDEPCRHKALDLIGDLALIGKPILGHVIAERAGHAMHVALVSKIMSDSSLYEVLTYDQMPEAEFAAVAS